MTGDNRFEDILILADGEERPKNKSEWIDKTLERDWNGSKRKTAFHLHKMEIMDDFIAWGGRRGKSWRCEIVAFVTQSGGLRTSEQ